MYIYIYTQRGFLVDTLYFDVFTCLVLVCVSALLWFLLIWLLLITLPPLCLDAIDSLWILLYMMSYKRLKVNCCYQKYEPWAILTSCNTSWGSELSKLFRILEEVVVSWAMLGICLVAWAIVLCPVSSVNDSMPTCQGACDANGDALHGLCVSGPF